MKTIFGLRSGAAERLHRPAAPACRNKRRFIGINHNSRAICGSSPVRPISTCGALKPRIVTQPVSKEESLQNCIRLVQGQSNLPAFSHHMAEVGKAMGDESTTL